MIKHNIGMEQSRRDDLESLGFFAMDEFKIQKQIRALKINILKLCKDLPVEFNKYMTCVKSLGFADEPNYNYLKKLFRTLFLKENYQYDDKYDWIKDDPSNGNDKRNMFEKFKSVNPTPAIKIDQDYQDYHKEESPKYYQDEGNNLYESKVEKNNNTLEVGFKRKNTRKSTQEYIKKVELQLKDEDEQEYKDELIDNVNELSNQINSKQAQLNAEQTSSDFDTNKVYSNPIITAQQNQKRFVVCDKTSSNEQNDFECELGDDIIAEEDEQHIVDTMLRKLSNIQMKMQQNKFYNLITQQIIQD